MATPFYDIFVETVEMFDIAARMAEEEAMSTSCDPLVLDGLVQLTRSCKRLMMESKVRAQDARQEAEVRG